MEAIKQKLKSVELCLSAHPDNEEHSEFADRISDLQALPKEIENASEKSRIEGVLVGLKICKELWAQGTISHETIQEEIYHYQEELDNLNSNQ